MADDGAGSDKDGKARGLSLSDLMVPSGNKLLDQFKKSTTKEYLSTLDRLGRFELQRQLALPTLEAAKKALGIGQYSGMSDLSPHSFLSSMSLGKYLPGVGGVTESAEYFNAYLASQAIRSPTPVSGLMDSYSSLVSAASMLKAVVGETPTMEMMSSSILSTFGSGSSTEFASMAAESLRARVDAQLARSALSTLGVSTISGIASSVFGSEYLNSLVKEIEAAKKSPLYGLFSSEHGLTQSQISAIFAAEFNEADASVPDEEEVVRAYRNASSGVPVRPEIQTALMAFLIKLYLLIELFNAMYAFYENVEKLTARLSDVRTAQEVKHVVRHKLGGVDKDVLKNIRIVNRKDVNLRGAPNQKSDVLTTMPIATQVEVLGADGKAWLHVVVDVDGEQIEGWMLRRYAQRIR